MPMLNRIPLLLLLLACGQSTSSPADDPIASPEVTTPQPSPTEPTPPEPAPAPDTTQAPATPEASKSLCCGQCQYAASKDPAGRDISMDPCAGYAGYTVNGKVTVDQACSAWFLDHPMTVSDCR